MDSGTKTATSSWLLAIAELDAVIARAREIARSVEAALHRSSTEAQPAVEAPSVDTQPRELPR